MEKFLLKDDFYTIATNQDLNVLSNCDDSILESCNNIAISEAISYISTRYDVDKLFADLNLFDSGSTYNIDDRIYTIDNSGRTTHYTCISATTSGSTITDTIYYKRYDSRDHKLKECILSMSLYYIHKRLSPINIPIFRKESYDGNGNPELMSAIKWLMRIQKGELYPYKWPEIEITENELDKPYEEVGLDMEGNDASNGMMWGNDMASEYQWYNEYPDKNIIIKNNE